MESSDLKNMVVLKNLPSNIIEEAIIIFKETQKVKQKELIDKSQKMNLAESKTKSKDYILREAEMLVSDYIKKMENGKNKEISSKISEKYKFLKKYSIFSTALLVISLIFNMI